MFWINSVELATETQKIIGITPAMPSGSMKYMMEAFPERAFRCWNC
jgi:1-deoxy-D-xylulose-5-phosphate synthase